MLVKKCSGFSGYFQIQKGMLQYNNPKINDTFEINVQRVQAINIEKNDSDLALSTLSIIGNYQILKSIILPTNYAKDAKCWIYLHLHFLGRKDTSKAHKDVQTAEYIQYKKNQKMQTFFITMVVIILLTGLYQTISYSCQVENMKKEAKAYTTEELLTTSNQLIEKEEYDAGIQKLLLLYVTNPSQDLRNKLDNAYLKRGQYHLSVENIPSARRDFACIKGNITELPPLKAKITEYENKLWLRFFDVSDLISFSWGTLTHNLDKGPNKVRTEELARTWDEFQTKLTYTRINHPIIQGIKDFLQPRVR